MQSNTTTGNPNATTNVAAPDLAKAAVLVPSNTTPTTAQVKGYDFNRGNNVEDLLATFKVCGFQATNFGLAVDEINRMLSWRLSDQPYDSETEPDELEDPEVRKNVKCTIFLGYTSNLVSSGVRESIRFLVQHKLVNAVVTTAGGIEEDIIKCLAPTYMGDFNLKGAELRSQVCETSLTIVNACIMMMRTTGTQSDRKPVSA